ERVETLRGPSALYFGRGGTGGVVNRVTKKPILPEYIDMVPAKGIVGGKNPGGSAGLPGGYGATNFSRVGASLDTFGGYAGNIDFNQAVGDDAAFRLNSQYEYLENHRNNYYGDRWAVNPTFAFRVNDKTRVDLSYEYNDFERYIDRGIPTGANGRPVSSLKSVTFGDTDLNLANFRAHIAKAAVTYDINDDWTARLHTQYGWYDKRYANTYARGYDPVTGVVTMDGYVDTTKRGTYQLSGDVVGNFFTGALEHNVFVGAEYVHTSNDNDRFTDSFTNGNQFNASTFAMTGGFTGTGIAGPTTMNLTTLNDDRHATVDVYSVYLQDEIAIGDKVDLVLGGRYDTFDFSVADIAGGGTNSRSDSNFSPRAGVVFKPTENISIYGSYSETFLPLNDNQYAGGNLNFDPNEFTNMEAGINVGLKENLGLRLAVFEGELSQQQASATVPGTTVRVDSETTGFEAELTGYLTDRWFVSAGYTYLDGEIVNQAGGTGLRPRELPENMFSIWNKYDVTERLGLGLGLIYQDESFINNGNTATLPSYVRVDAAAFYKLSDKTRLQVNVENLFDEEYFPSSHSTHQATVGAPINASFSIKTEF
ncbi:MAG: TonB-dependent receptor, partial [Verrucomicrobiota bacterium]